MTVTAIRLQNFMAFGEGEDDNEGWIELRPISLLFGRNSSGKSAIIRALRLLKQSIIETPEGARFAFNIEDGLNAGNHESIIHGNDLKRFSYYSSKDDWEDWLEVENISGEKTRERKKKTVDFAFSISIGSTRLQYYLHSSELKADTKQVQFSLKFGVIDEVFDLVSFSLEVPLHYPNENYVIFEAGRLPKNDLADEMGDWWFGGDSLIKLTETDDLSIWRTQEIRFRHGFLPYLFTPEIAQRYIPNDHSITHIQKLLEVINADIVMFLSNIQYVRPVRPEPQRDFILTASEVMRWRRRGLQAYLKLLGNNVPELPNKRLNQWLTELQLGTAILSAPSKDTSDGSVVSKLLLREKGSGYEINLSDVGFGASQIIPILIESLLATENSLVIIEQPELHLHPAAQATLADLFIECATVQGTRFLIETHSEYVLLRLRRRIAETLAGLPDTIYPVSIENITNVFVNRVKEKSTVELIELGDRGDITKSPKDFEGFFSDDLHEIAKLTEAQLFMQIQHRRKTNE